MRGVVLLTRIESSLHVLLWKDQRACAAAARDRSASFWDCVPVDPAKDREEQDHFLSLSPQERVAEQLVLFFGEALFTGKDVYKMILKRPMEFLGEYVLIPIPFVPAEELCCAQGRCRWVPAESLCDASQWNHLELFLLFRAQLESILEDLKTFLKQLSETHKLVFSTRERCESKVIEENPTFDEFLAHEVPGQIFRCKKCNMRLCSDLDLVEHERGSGQDAFAWRKRRLASEVVCSSVFVDPYSELGLLISSSDDSRVLCPKCHSRLGVWSWAGSQCSCGSWISPAFQLLRKHLDVRLVRNDE